MVRLIMGVVGMALGTLAGLLLFHLLRDSLLGKSSTGLLTIVYLGAGIVGGGLIGTFVGFFLGLKLDALWEEGRRSRLANKDNSGS